LFHLCAAGRHIEAGADLLEPVFYHGGKIDADAIQRRINEKAAGRANWVIGAGGQEAAATINRMFEKGFSGPLWEYLIR